MIRISKAIVAVMAAVSALSVSAAALAQDGRSPEYEAARKAGQVGEKPDGYLGIIGSAPASLQKLVDSLNIKRRAIYTDAAQSTNQTLDQAAAIGGCRAILRTVPGEKYMTPAGNWETRTSARPQLAEVCKTVS